MRLINYVSLSKLDDKCIFHYYSGEDEDVVWKVHGKSGVKAEIIFKSPSQRSRLIQEL